MNTRIQFYNIARASCGEVRSLLYVIEDNYPAIETSPIGIRADAIQTGRLISGLLHSTRKRLAGTFLVLLFGIAGLTFLIPHLIP